MTTIFGYTHEQLLGQSCLTIFDEESNEKSKIGTQIELMNNRQSELIYENHIICISDNNSKISCSITIIGITNESDKIESHLTFILLHLK